jgi:hypothetical protein
MFHFTMCGGSDIQLKEEDNIVVTIWGGTYIYLPTIAEKMIRIKKHDSNPSTHPLERRANVITIMGGTAWFKPTIAREIEEMTQLRDSGAIDDEEIAHYWKRATEEMDLDIFETITLMGGAGEENPSRRMEWKAMERLCLTGLISSEELEDFKAMLNGDFSKVRASLLQSKMKELLQGSSTPARLSQNSPRLPNTALER